MRKLIALLVFGTSLLQTMAQQVPIYNHYFLNPYLINPARAGGGEGTNAYLLHRQQWVGIPGAPITDVLSIDGAVKSKRVGLGLMVSNDVTNIVGKTSVMGTYAYHAKINSISHLSAGISAGILQNRIQFNKMVVGNSTDNTILANAESRTTFDANFGLAYQLQRFEFGIAVNQLLANKMDFSDQAKFKELSWQNIRHYTATMSYTFNLKKDVLTLTPIALVRSAEGLPVQAEGNLLLNYKKMAWINLGYRHEAAVSMALGVRAYENISVGYCYEYPLTSLSQFSSGSHEIIVGFRFSKNKRDEVYVPDPGAASPGDPSKVNTAQAEQYDQLIERIEALAHEVKKSKDELAHNKEEMHRQQQEIEKLKKEIAHEQKTAIKDTDFVDLDKVKDFETKGHDYYVVLGAFKTIRHSKHFQKIVHRDRNITTQVMENKNKTFYFVYSVKVNSKEEAYAEIYRLKKLDVEEIIGGNIWVHKEEK
ncbi:MAG: PorP/SprF family type IX secretion system membrane protein [Bacteroidia bacterium]